MIEGRDITDAQLEAFPPAIQSWIKQHDLSTVTFLNVAREILPDGTENGWTRWKHGPHMTVHLSCKKGGYKQVFKKQDNGEWTEVKENKDGDITAV